MGLPPEIIVEIATFVTPGDLIYLCRTNKPLRNMFFRRPAASIWRLAQSNVPGLPPCPIGMAEPAPRGRGYVDGSRGPYCLREELEAGKVIREVMKGTEGWEEKAKENLQVVNEEAAQLKAFIRTLSVSDITWKESMIKAKRESVRNKLRVLGWDQQELELSDDLKRQWDRIVDVPTPLTERNWAYLEVKLVSLITVNRSQIPDIQENEEA
ncbi:hypothetical protein FRC11_003260 [Ceratobasidium sp. 423]|nr:hypothetical protein FRC11_003260 [Ceratobasidium sp. 423]